jgi:hypothetical protein
MGMIQRLVMLTKFWFENVEGRDLEVLDIVGRIILKWILKM